FNVQPLAFGLNKSFYDQLPVDLQEMMDGEISEQLIELFVDTYTNELDKSISQFKEYTEGKGGLSKLPAEEEAKFKAPAEESWKQWVEEANEKGYPGEEMMEEFKALLKEEGIEIPF